jgi:signal transduction histidine kinase
VQVRGECVGVLWVNSQHKEHFRARDAVQLQSLASYGAIAVERAHIMEAVKGVNKAIADMLKLDELIQDLLREIVDELGLEFAALQLVDRERNEIETVDGINVPWAAEARHSLDSNDIQAVVAKTGRMEIISGPDPRFDPRIYERFGHEMLVRAFIPIAMGDTVFGTVEAGFDRRNRPTITDDQLDALCALVKRYASSFKEATLGHVLETIVSSAVSMVRADSGSIHVLFDRKRGRYIYESTAGRIGREFLDAFPPRPTDEGWNQKVLHEGEPLWEDDPGVLKRTHPAIYRPEILLEKYRHGEGVRALACFPLLTGGTYSGVFYVHFWRRHTFSDEEIELLKLFADQASVAMQDAQVYEKLRSHNQALTCLAMIGQSLAGVLDPLTLLPMIALSARTVLKADIVTIYEYNEAAKRFHTPPTIEGNLNHRGPMQSEVDTGDAQWVLVHERRRSVYAPDAGQEAVLCNPNRQRPSAKRETFVEREGIASAAGILLKARHEIVGVMFVNYRSHREFSTSDRRVIENFASYAAIAIHTARTASRRRIAAEKLADLATISNNLQHRMANKVGAIRPLAQQIRARFPEEEYVRDKTTAIEECASESLDMIRRLRTTLKLSEPRVTSLNEALQQGRLDVITRELDERIKILQNYDRADPKVMANPERLSEVFLNLIKNAVEALPGEAGTIELGTRITRKGWAEAWVLDTGRGIPDAMKPRIFELFASSKAQGLGYGLWWVKTYVQMLGGDVRVVSETGRGSRFVVELPLVE